MGVWDSERDWTTAPDITGEDNSEEEVDDDGGGGGGDGGDEEGESEGDVPGLELGEEETASFFKSVQNSNDTCVS